MAAAAAAGTTWAMTVAGGGKATGGGKTAGIGKGAWGLAHSAGIRRPTTRAASQAAQGVLEGMRRP